jgi:hypothetical protein
MKSKKCLVPHEKVLLKYTTYVCVVVDGRPTYYSWLVLCLILQSAISVNFKMVCDTGLFNVRI